ncbi:MAG: hypothetical protein Q8920_08535 [Bacillota bacterium]|nr:hypothetical protein [Bacillota bacterium]
MKKFVMGLIIGILSTMSITALAAGLNIIPNPIPIFVNGTKTDLPGYNINNSTYLQLSAFKKIGLGVNYDSQTKHIDINTKDLTTSAPDTANSNTGGNKMTDENGIPYIEQDGAKYVYFVDCIKFCDSKGYSFGVKDFLQSPAHWSIVKNNYHPYGQTKYLEGDTEFFTFNGAGNVYFEYDFVVNTLLTFMMSNN